MQLLPAVTFVGISVAFPRTGAAQQSQLSDPAFDPSVTRPAYQVGSGPRVGFDEAHHNFHTAAGRYKAFADLLTRDGFRLSPNRDRLSHQVLRSYDVLVIANALGASDPGDAAASSAAFTEDEAKSLAAWVRNGNALLLISDHQPAGAAVQILATQFGVRMSNATVVDTTPGNHLEGHFQTNLEFTRTNGLLKRQTITDGRDSSERVVRVVAFGGQSLKGPPDAACLLALGPAAFEVRPPSREKVAPAGDCMGLAFRFGRGRVVVTGEAGMLSAQLVTEDGPNGVTTHPWGMNWPGVDNRQLALNIARWLSGALR
ncbi:MAG TPA: hypothetical protein VKA54_10610 [Gemmatimonadaceae bacterium]|nr:hypothetical protein [Gemmatimonadaceae bacterium]